VKAVRSIPDTVPAVNRTLGWQVLDWTAEYLLQPDGPTAGAPWEFTREQTRIVLRWYAIDAKGRFVYRRGVLRRMKGWGKNPLLDVIAAVELCGPCRFGGWDTEGLPVAVPHPAPWVQIAAVSQDQTRNSMTLFGSLFSDAAVDTYDLDIGKTIVYARGATGQIESVTSSPRALEGRRSTLVVLDESQHWLPSNDGWDMAEAIRRNLAKAREGAARSLEITNAHLPGEGSVAEATFEAWKSANGKVPGLYYDALEAPALEDLSDQTALREALRLARGDSTWLDLDRLVAEVQDPATPAWIARRFYLNQVIAVGAERWIDPDAWAACAAPDRVVEDGAPILIGFDGSFSNDSTAAIGVLVAEVPHLFVIGHWQPSEPGDEVDILDVEAALLGAGRRYNVIECAADPFRWARSLQVLFDEGLPVCNFSQSASRMTPATARFSAAVATGALTHSGDERLTTHVLNAVVVSDARGTRVQKDSKRSPRKIDLAVAALMALDRCSQSEDADKELQRQRRRHGVAV
jgi:phage terminase large subunit-like protein